MILKNLTKMIEMIIIFITSLILAFIMIKYLFLGNEGYFLNLIFK
ncbi:MAG: hypothetical protein KatS3mg093_310 [Candidatus Parcubacteria bacterium]|nr:MAG: hypothetical protein KatS3mg093_310 [Candidatus Parcubacteria bacterium]